MAAGQALLSSRTQKALRRLPWCFVRDLLKDGAEIVEGTPLKLISTWVEGALQPWS